MSFKLRNRIRSSPLLLVRGEKAVLNCLADYAREDGTGIYPGVLRIAREISYSERWVRKMLRGLEQKGVLIHHGTVGGRGHTSKYEICEKALFPAPKPAAPADEFPADNFPPAAPADEPFLPDESPLILLKEKLQKARQTLQQRQDQQAFKVQSGNRSYTLDSLIERSQERVDELEQELAQLTSAQREHQYTT